MKKCNTILFETEDLIIESKEKPLGTIGVLDFKNKYWKDIENADIVLLKISRLTIPIKDRYNTFKNADLFNASELFSSMIK